MRKFLSDLFKGISGQNWELARILAAWAVASFSGTFIGAFIRGQPLDFAAIGTGFGIVLAGAGGLIWAKDSARTAAVTAANPPPDPSKVEVVNPPERPVQTEDAGR